MLRYVSILTSAMTKPRKTYYEGFARFFEQPTRESLRELLKENVGEFRLCDFKEALPDGSSLARHLLALANSGGGCLVIGVAERDDKTLDPVGLSTITDKKVITDQIKGYIPGELLQRIDMADFAYDAAEYAKLQGKRFQVLFVESEAKDLPYIAVKGGVNIRQNAIYSRREGSSDEASYEELQTIINRRLETGHSTRLELDLKAELDQLRALYGYLSPGRVALRIPALENLARLFPTESMPNPNYPAESFEAFVAKLIEKKKLRIIQQLGL